MEFVFKFQKTIFICTILSGIKQSTDPLLKSDERSVVNTLI